MPLSKMTQKDKTPACREFTRSMRKIHMGHFALCFSRLIQLSQVFLFSLGTGHSYCFLHPLFVYSFFSVLCIWSNILLLIKFEKEILSVKYRTGITFSASLCTFANLLFLLFHLVWLRSTVTGDIPYPLNLTHPPSNVIRPFWTYAYLWLICLSLPTLFLLSLLYLASDIVSTPRYQPQIEQKL